MAEEKVKVTKDMQKMADALAKKAEAGGQAQAEVADGE